MYSQIENKTVEQLELELARVYVDYEEYHEIGFINMIKLFAIDDFYNLHLVAKEYLNQLRST